MRCEIFFNAVMRTASPADISPAAPGHAARLGRLPDIPVGHEHDPPAIAIIGIEHDAVDDIGRVPRPGADDPRRSPHAANALKDLCSHRRSPIGLRAGSHQNRKYLWAIGNTSAGAQVRSSPSAVTS